MQASSYDELTLRSTRSFIQPAMLDDLELESTVRKGAGQDDYSLSHPHPFSYFLLSLTPLEQISFSPLPWY